MGSTFVIIGLIPILVLIGIAAGAPLIILGLRQRAALRRTGVNADNPGCAKCLYIMRGWDSPICPECGVDVRQAGARVGVHHNRFLKCLVALVGSSILTAVILWLVCRWLFAMQSNFETSQYVTGSQGLAAGYPAVLVQIQTVRETRRFPKHFSNETELIIDPNNALGPVAVFARVQGMRPIATWPMVMSKAGDDTGDWHGLYIATGDELPTNQDVVDLVNESLELDDALALALAAEVHTLTVNQTGAQPVQFSPTVLSGIGSGSGQVKGMWWLGQMVVWIGTIVTTLTFVTWVSRRHKPGVRPVEEGEWARTAPDSEAEPI